MKKLESSLLNMVVSLGLVAVLVGMFLAFVNHITATPIRLQEEKALADGIQSVMGGVQVFKVKDYIVNHVFENKQYSFIIHKIYGNSGTMTGAAVESTVGAFGGDMKILVGLDTKGKILGYTILQHTETPGLGAKANVWFQKDGKGCIVGKKPSRDNLSVKNDGGCIDAITASTITSRAFLKAVNQAYEVYGQMMKKNIINEKNTINQFEKEYSSSLTNHEKE